MAGILAVVPRIWALPPTAQRLAFAAVTTVSRAMIRWRRSPRPPLGSPTHLTSILRVGDASVPRLDVGPPHYRYPPSTVHITVANLDAATVELDVALRRLRTRRLLAPSITIEGLGCSPDTVFLRCTADDRLAQLRQAVLADFGVGRAGAWTTRLFGSLAFANVVRFDGPGHWIRQPLGRRSIVGVELEIVRTDRYLSEPGTIVVARIPLVPAADDEP